VGSSSLRSLGPWPNIQGCPVSCASLPSTDTPGVAACAVTLLCCLCNHISYVQPVGASHPAETRVRAAGPRRRLSNLENRTEQMSQVVADIQQVSGLRDDAHKERLGALEKTLREVHRGVQIIRDKQVGALCAR
jgi:hypothetical protein